MKRKAWGYRADQLSSTHPVAGEAADTGAALLNFDGISYAKGASALRQLVEWVGDDAFLAGLRRHFADHAFDNASLADLVDALTASSGRDVSTWADQWLRTSGPEHRVARRQRRRQRPLRDGGRAAGRPGAVAPAPDGDRPVRPGR